MFCFEEKHSPVRGWECKAVTPHNRTGPRHPVIVRQSAGRYVQLIRNVEEKKRRAIEGEVERAFSGVFNIGREKWSCKESGAMFFLRRVENIQLHMIQVNHDVVHNL